MTLSSTIKLIYNHINSKKLYLQHFPKIRPPDTSSPAKTNESSTQFQQEFLKPTKWEKGKTPILTFIYTRDKSN